MARFTITLPQSVASRLEVDERRLSIPRSTLIAQYLEQYFSQRPAAEYEAIIYNLQKELRECQEQSTAKVTSQDTVISGLQKELEFAKTQTKNLDEKLVIYSGIINDLKSDKETLQKQVELLTLRLPAPRVGFWSRIFGSGKKKEDVKE